MRGAGGLIALVGCASLYRPAGKDLMQYCFGIHIVSHGRPACTAPDLFGAISMHHKSPPCAQGPRHVRKLLGALLLPDKLDEYSDNHVELLRPIPLVPF